MNLAEGKVQEAITNIQKKREQYEGENGMPVVPRYNTKKYTTFKKVTKKEVVWCGKTAPIEVVPTSSGKYGR